MDNTRALSFLSYLISDLMKMRNYNQARVAALRYREVAGKDHPDWEMIVAKLVEEDEIQLYGF